MKSLGLGRYAFAIGAAAAMLAGCGGSQPAIGAPGMTQQSRTVAKHTDRGRSWMLPEAKTGDLLYVGRYPIDILAYPSGKPVGQLSTGGSLCSDKSGDVFVSYGNQIDEYAHGGTDPIASLSESYDTAFGCASDPTTGNLAVVNGGLFGSRSGNVAIYQKAQGSPQIYTDPDIYYYYYCGYDNQGDLFIDGRGPGDEGDNFVFAELSKGSSTFTDISLNLKGPVHPFGTIQWDGKYLTLEDQDARAIYRISVSGTSGTIVGGTDLRQWSPGTALSWIFGKRVISWRNKHVGLWQYPSGKFVRALELYVDKGYFGVTISVAPH